MKTVIFDIDGTLADISHRRHYVASKPKNWAAFNAGMAYDKVNHDVKEVLDMYRERGYHITIVTGRDGEFSDETLKWLRHHKIHFDNFRIRPKGDYRPDYVIKEEILDHMLSLGYKIHAVFDDRDQVVEMWRRRGYRCFQVAKGNF